MLNLTPNGPSSPHYDNGEGSVWMSGAGLTGDTQGNIYFLDANGSFDATLNANGFPTQGDFGNSFMKVSTTGNVLAAADYFAAYDLQNESAGRDDNSVEARNHCNGTLIDHRGRTAGPSTTLRSRRDDNSVETGIIATEYSLTTAAEQQVPPLRFAPVGMTIL